VRVKSHKGFDSLILYSMYQPVEMKGGFKVYRYYICSLLNEDVDEVLRIGYHKVHVYGNIGYSPHSAQYGHSKSNVGNEMTIHNIYMDEIHHVLHFLYLSLEIPKIACQNRCAYFDHPFFPPFFTSSNSLNMRI